MDVCRWTYLLGFPQLEPTNGEGFGAVSPRGKPCRTASSSASTVSLIPSLLCTSITERFSHCELLRVFRCSVVPKFGDSSYLKPTERHSCSHPRRKKKETRPQSRCAGVLQRKGHFHFCLFILMLLVKTGLLFLVTCLDSPSELLHILILRPHPNALAAQLFLFASDTEKLKWNGGGDWGLCCSRYSLKQR